MCEGDSFKGTPKGVVYSAVCTECDEEDGVNKEGSGCAEYTYIGESGDHSE